MYTKDQVNYSEGTYPDTCGECVHYSKVNKCELVDGFISTSDTCDLFHTKNVSPEYQAREDAVTKMFLRNTPSYELEGESPFTRLLRKYGIIR